MESSALRIMMLLPLIKCLRMAPPSMTVKHNTWIRCLSDCYTNLVYDESWWGATPCLLYTKIITWSDPVAAVLEPTVEKAVTRKVKAPQHENGECVLYDSTSLYICREQAVGLSCIERYRHFFFKLLWSIKSNYKNSYRLDLIIVFFHDIRRFLSVDPYGSSHYWKDWNNIKLHPNGKDES